MSPIRSRSKLVVISLALGLAVAVGAGLVSAPVHADQAETMKSWMKKNMGATRASNDFPGLATAFDKVAAKNPDPAFTEWAAISKQGAAAAKGRDMQGVKDSCKGCHEKYKDAYKAKYADRPYAP